ncbi:hypothetical protein CWATWH8502_1447 [Crocosphaera watsonii WH 8502]|uniref:Uncharacterized protein n=5 Tax=Crocosphaera watsonii TaxID=263511 RepID=T2JNV4_CROWT|nr:hypothetical protein CWATWH0003_1899 [Crocosphaera watsonii WH 0003]CCQ51684.1 hypothetical protein CWATWH8502_1447 [Crocosphaera watsonii WH 8502]CCQ56071.1 hypothetical protein CWATWH0005_5117 [Crocosphaera watsonii WH 0005]CCQ63353.1 hypothetical protein CWATWH0401_1718 [Crocosphaera watsonii WH 0401]CCQ67578.1 hypothetical protein CWATWH0402_4619 [Crocosphaera watsonii WH 0402]
MFISEQLPVTSEPLFSEQELFTNHSLLLASSSLPTLAELTLKKCLF